MIEIIAEAGANHNGNVENALNLVNIAVEANASSIKFQFIFPDGLYIPAYLSNGQLVKNDVYDHREREMLSTEEWHEVWAHAKNAGIEIFASVFCGNGISLLKRLGAKTVKIASTDLNNVELINSCLKEFDRCILSTGMASLSDIEQTLFAINFAEYKNKLELMHCVSTYPCPLELGNLKRIKALETAFGLKVGYSDHTLGASSACAALALGCTTFEKHFTYDKTLSGFDHAHAEDPEGLSQYAQRLSKLCDSLKYQVDVDSQQKVTKNRARRGIYAARHLKAGTVLSRKDLLVVRPSTMLGPEDLHLVVGQTIETDLMQYQPLEIKNNIHASNFQNKDAASYWTDEMKLKGMKK